MGVCTGIPRTPTQKDLACTFSTARTLLLRFFCSGLLPGRFTRHSALPHSEWAVKVVWCASETGQIESIPVLRASAALGEEEAVAAGGAAALASEASPDPRASSSRFATNEDLSV